MQNTLVNQDFERAVKQLRRILPKLSFGLLIGTYLISAFIMGIFHSQNSPHIGFKVAAFLVPLAIQAGRGTLVFFFQLNPARIQSRFSMGIIAATTLLGLSLWEAWLVMSPYGLSWTVSVSTLMLIGWVIEIMILKETMFATQMQLYQNKDQWQELHNFYVARADFDQFMDDLYDGKKPVLPGPDHTSNPEEAPKLEDHPKSLESDRKAESLPEGNGFSPSLNGQTL
ncbi:hypothetical protein [Flavilitoribacter nigricans]|uniref:Uncharacterized protein n=1 Tax=Flavilitoribacter nigricans (strain ATCC 23147 / DSM 23189 / NBRC 102662 / NCIMB 1420 / SS-2) TaxID=1122177 RepID=A0A2D0MXM7_FLAN2|nr:hypothetical protein [Flavilitoribacter nigricans]PHN00930.1 hypothetical protein CRP01_39740 [Flavilitoribacter nigricans DSM 23189 = NBRC 102662]